MLRREEEEEREEREKERREIIDKLETSNKNAAQLIAKSRANAAKRSSARTVSAPMVQSSAKLLRTRAAIDLPDVPHVPFLDDFYRYDEPIALKQGGYDDMYSQAVRRDREGIMRGGGYMVEEAWARALRDSYAGLAISPLVGDSSAVREPVVKDEAGDVVMASA